MKFLYAASILTTLSLVTPLWAVETPQAGSNLGSVKGGDFQPARNIITQKCTSCHNATLIDTALSASKDMLKIQQQMEKRGAELGADERDVLGIFWKQQNPLKQKK